MDIRQKIRSGHYSNKVDIRRPREMPALLRKKVSDLTADELAVAPKVKEDYEKTISAHKQSQREYSRERDRIHDEFKSDLCQEYYIDPKSKLGNELFKLAWERGHSAGYNEVVSEFESLMPIVEAAKEEFATKPV